MLPAPILAKKRDGHELSDEEIRFLIDGFVAGTVADYQMTAFAMAVLLRGMTAQETASLTRAMLESGDRLPRASGGPPRVDKHSTGGLGDKVSLSLAPLLACHGVHVPMISGRGLGLSGGTLDKLEAIPGFRCQLDPRQLDRQLQSLGCFIIGASDTLAPADRRLYALRDVTATVPSIPLITASILSKKLAATLDVLVMDVKVGCGAFMKTIEQATRLAHSLVQTGANAGLRTTAMLTDMDQPLGRAVGNAIEVNETLELLSGEGPREVNELTVALSAQTLVEADIYRSVTEASDALRVSIDSGLARERLEQMIAAQGGRLTGPLPLAPAREVLATREGFVAAVDCESIGRCVLQMGGGRRQADDAIDPSVGVSVKVRIGDHVVKGQPLLTLHAATRAEHHAESLREVCTLVEQAVDARPLVIEVISGVGTPAEAKANTAARTVGFVNNAFSSTTPQRRSVATGGVGDDAVERLVQSAREVRSRAHAPYSGFQVGAALLCDDDSVFVGCNIENASFSLTLCAERVAAASAVAAQRCSWKAIAIASPGAVAPCGACRQCLAEFGNDLRVICVDTDTDKRNQYMLSHLLPHAFHRGALEASQARPSTP